MREKLIKLITEGRQKCAYMPCEKCKVIFSSSCMDELLADHLIAHGVTIQDREIDFDYEAEVE